jgi:DNA-directed RNA polymerase beta' subunit
MAKDIVTVVVNSLNEAGVKPTKSSVTYYYLKAMTESYRLLHRKNKRLLNEGAELDPEQVQAALEDAAAQLSTLQDFLNPDNMKRFEAAAEFIPQLDEFFGSLNTHFELQKVKEEEAAEEAESAAQEAEAEAEREAEEAAGEAEEDAAEQDVEAEEDSAAAEEAEIPPPEEAPPAEKAEAEPAEEAEEELAESLVRRWKTLANIRG